MKNRKYGAVTSFTLLSNNETERKSNGTWRILLEAVVFIAVLALVTLLLRQGYKRYMCAAYPIEYSKLVNTYANEYGFEPSLLFALIRTESGFDPDAVSSANAYGLMQITKDTFDWAQIRSPEKETLAVEELFTPEINIRYGVLILSLLRDEFENTQTMLAAYNAGIGKVRGWLKDGATSEDGVSLKNIPFEETRNYVNKIPKAKELYKELYDIK